jgi:catechol 2,3-dioxygenase-like lactoylglutathione lyase family enzyme
MKWQKMEIVGVTVSDFDQAVADFTDLFGVEFLQWLSPPADYEAFPIAGSEHIPQGPSSPRRVAIDRSGVWELVETPQGEEGFYNIHLKVEDIEAAKEELLAKELRLIRDLRIGRLREAVFMGERLHGIRLCVAQYDGEVFVDEALRL